MNDGQCAGCPFLLSHNIEVIRAGFGGDHKITAAIRCHIDTGYFGNCRGECNGGHAIAGFNIDFIDHALSEPELLKQIVFLNRFRQFRCIHGKGCAAEQSESEKFVFLHNASFQFQFSV